MAITPRFNEQTEDAILDRILSGVSDEVDKRQGSIAYDLTAPVAAELAEAYVNLDLAINFAFLSEDMPSEILTLAAADFGVDRKEATKSSGLVTLQGPEGQLVTRGTNVRTDYGVYFTTQNDVVLTSGIGMVPVEANVGGTGGNVEAGHINAIVGDLVGVVSVTNEMAFTNGIDEESDEALLQRTYDKVRKPATSGNVHHYEQWAKSVTGVGDARVYPLWDGVGTVKVVLLSDEKRAPDVDVVNEVADYIETERPIGAEVTVVAADEVPITISAELTLTVGGDLATVQADIEKGVTDYLKTLAFSDTLVRYTRIAAIILDVSHVIDYANLTLNGTSGNIEVTGDNVAVLNEVTVNAIQP